TIPVMPEQPLEPPLAMGAPPVPEPPPTPPAPPPPAEGRPRPSLFASPTQRLDISEALAAALVRELSQSNEPPAPAPAAEPPLAMGAPAPEPPLAMPAPQVVSEAPEPLVTAAPTIRELPPPQPPLLTPLGLRPGDALPMAPGADDTPLPATPDAVDVTRLHDYITNHDLARAFAAFHKGLESAPANRELRQHLAHTYFQNGMLDEALSEFESLVDADPQNVRYRQQLAESSLWTADATRSVKNMLGYANCLQKEGSFDEAVAVLEDCVALDPSSSRARLALADLHLQLNLPNLALYHLNTLSDVALQRDDREGTLATLNRLHTMTGDPVYQQRLASALVKFGQPDEALGQYRELALKARQRGDMHTSLHGWQQILQVEPEHEEALENLTELYRALNDGEHFLATVSVLARVCRQNGKLDRARTYLETILSVDGRRLDVRKQLVEIYLELNNLPAASHEAQTVLESAMQFRDYPSAIELLTRLSGADPDNLSWREQLAGVYELM
ncbi:MAG TPA: tetratricopeptide repeat protein, partial [Candidatus Xenobia bacterium]